MIAAVVVMCARAIATLESEQYKFEFVVHMQLQLDIATTYKGYRIIIRSACLFSVSYRPEDRGMDSNRTNA